MPAKDFENPISQFLQERINANDFPSAVYVVAEKGEIVLHGALGLAVAEPKKIKARRDTIYDLASLTKPLVTGLLAAKLLDSGKIDLEARLEAYLEGSDLGDKGSITVRQLLTHTSGLPAWKPLYLLTDDPSDIQSVIARQDRASSSSAVTYSDLNFLLLEILIKRIIDTSLEAAAVEWIVGPLGLSATRFNPPAAIRDSIAASELGNQYEKNTCHELFPLLSIPDSAFRHRQIWGEVHDGNAYFLGGIAGHAGLFSTADEVFKIALQFLPKYTTVLKPATCELFRTDFTQGANEHRSFAFQLASTPGSTAGTLMSPGSFGHLGFTGTSLWIDPVKDRVFILLTNRTHVHPLPFTNINSVRRRFHDLAILSLEEKRSN